MSTSKSKHFIKKCFCDHEGRLVLFQLPNLPFSVWFGSLVITSVTSGTVNRVFEVVSFGALFTWAWLEIFKGDSYFRRVLGLIVMIVIISNRVKG